MAKISDISNKATLSVIDQMGRQVDLPHMPSRIISLVPSITEYLVDLGLEDRLVGRTKFCIRPERVVQTIPAIGGTKKFDFDKISALEPDLIIGNKEENYASGIEQLAHSFPVWMSDILNLEHNFEMMESIGTMTGKSVEAASWIHRVRSNFRKYYKKYSGRVRYLIWRRPYMVAGRGTFISHVLEYLGYENAILQMRYPEIDPYILQRLKADQVFLSSEPFPFKQKDIQEFQKIFPGALTRLVDGEAFSWYGSRLAKVSFDF